MEVYVAKTSFESENDIDVYDSLKTIIANYTDLDEHEIFEHFDMSLKELLELSEKQLMKILGEELGIDIFKTKLITSSYLYSDEIPNNVYNDIIKML